MKTKRSLIFFYLALLCGMNTKFFFDILVLPFSAAKGRGERGGLGEQGWSSRRKELTKCRIHLDKNAIYTHELIIDNHNDNNNNNITQLGITIIQYFRIFLVSFSAYFLYYSFLYTFL